MARVIRRTQVASRLGRWLGPWTPGDRVPRSVVRGEVSIAAGPGERPMRAVTWTPASGRATGALFVVPGLHPDGPDDPRFSRFLAVLAASGIAAFSPCLPDFMVLRLAPTLLTDVERAFAAFEAWPQRPASARPGVMSISFGSRLALHLAETLGDERVGGVVLFGGYCDWREAMRFALGDTVDGAAAGPRDPLNTPAVFLNLLEGLDAEAQTVAQAEGAWRRYVAATWGRPEMKAPARHRPVAEALAAELPEAARALFLAGCNLSEHTLAVARSALGRLGDRDWLDPTRALGALGVPLTIVHGVDDDVIPVSHADRLFRLASPRARTRLLRTGLYGHTARAGADAAGVRAVAQARELVTMLRILRALARTACP